MENVCLSTKSYEHLRKASVFAQQAEKTNGKRILLHEKLRKPRENMFFAQQAVKT